MRGARHEDWDVQLLSQNCQAINMIAVLVRDQNPESECGSSPSAFMRLKVSRQEIPASTSTRVLELLTSAVLPRLPLANTVKDTPMSEA